MSLMPSLKVQDLCFGYSSQKLLFSKLSFECNPGEILYLKGPNGAGKTSLIHLLLGLLKPLSGSLEISCPLRYLAADSNALFSNLCAYDNLKFWADLKQVPYAYIDLELKYWGFHSKLETHFLPVQKFSTGMKRRLALARTFLTLSNECILILDEPFFGIDKKNQELLNQRITTSNHTFIIVSHENLGIKASQEIEL